MKTALLIVDVQNDYFPGGKMELHNSPEAAARTKKLLEIFRQKKLPVVHVRHISLRPGASFFLPDTHGSEINETVRPEPGERIIIKHFPNSFRETSRQATCSVVSIIKLPVHQAGSILLEPAFCLLKERTSVFHQPPEIT